VINSGSQDNRYTEPHTAVAVHYNTLTTSISRYILTSAMFAQWHTNLMPCLVRSFPLPVTYYVRIRTLIKPTWQLSISTLKCNLATFYLQFQHCMTSQNLLFGFHNSKGEASFLVAQDTMLQQNQILTSWRNKVPASSSTNATRWPITGCTLLILPPSTQSAFKMKVESSFKTSGSQYSMMQGHITQRNHRTKISWQISALYLL